MPIEILMPTLSPTMKEGNLANWTKKEGDKIKAGEVIAEIETDKATMEVEAVDAGILAKIIVPAGSENVAVNSLIALIIEEGESLESVKNYQIKQPESNQLNQNQEASKISVQNHNQANSSQENKPSLIENSSISSAIDNSSKIKASPLAKRIAENNNLKLSTIAHLGSGPSGRIIKDDVLNALKSKPNLALGVNRNPQEFTAIKNSNIRKVIARRLLESKQTVPHFYLSCELNIDKMLEMRASMNSVANIDGNEKPAYKISVNDLIIKASAMALNKVPNANSSWSDESLLLFNNVDISVAVAITSSVKVKWPSARYELRWDVESSKWLIYFNDKPKLAASGLHLYADTAIIQIVSITPSIYGDKFGEITPFSKTTGSGKAVLLRDGFAYPVDWQRNLESDVTSWRSADGKDVKFKAGKIWILLTDKPPVLAP